jgi:hypothetical protein
LGASPGTFGVLYNDSNILVLHPSLDLLRVNPAYYQAGEHCFHEKRRTTNAYGAPVPLWVYGPCPLQKDTYWMFESYVPGGKATGYGPYADYVQCDMDRRNTAETIPGISQMCFMKHKDIFRSFKKDGSLRIPKEAPPLD